MAGVVSLYPRVDFVEVGTPLSELAPEEVQMRLQEALILANVGLGEDVTVFYPMRPKNPLL